MREDITSFVVKEVFLFEYEGVDKLIEIKNLSKIYKSKDSSLEALKDINLTINDGEIYGIMGLSGAGKSSLLRCLNLIEEPTSGEILIDGVDITKLNVKELRHLRKGIGMIFQHFNLLMNSTVYDNIAFPLRLSKVSEDRTKERVLELLKVVDLADKKDSYPGQLSGGQKQRVGIARALASKPKFLLCDEATSALDPTTTESILSLLRDINKGYGITIIVITHEMNVIKHLCDKVAVLERGIIVESGNVVDIFSNPATETSRRFLKNIITEIPEELISKDENCETLRLYFLGDSSKEAIISRLIKEFEIDANILAGSIERIQNCSVGNLLIKLSGNRENINAAIKYLNNKKDLRIEVLKNAAV